MLEQFAQELNLDMERFRNERLNPEITSLINRDLREGSRIGVRGTPTIFVNGKRFGQRSIQAFSAAIENELKLQKLKHLEVKVQTYQIQKRLNTSLIN